MIEVDFKDRIPTHAGRVKLTPVDGQPNLFTMERADDPTEEGTPIDKATLESITKSRLTGRFYEPTAKRTQDTNYIGLTVSPLPTSGWVYSTGNRNKASSGTYTVEVDSDHNTSSQRAADAFTSTGWRNVGGTEAWLQIYHAQPFKVQNIVFEIEASSSSNLSQINILGSTNGSTWATLYSQTTLVTDSLLSYPLSNIGDYNYYKIVITSESHNIITIKSLRYSLYDIGYYNCDFIADKMPVEWDKGQRVTLYVPPSVNTLAVTKNTFNGITVNTMLQSGRRYELRYNGTSFDAKEV